MSKQKHLTISDRFYIEQELLQKTSFKTIALIFDVFWSNPTLIHNSMEINSGFSKVDCWEHRITPFLHPPVHINTVPVFENTQLTLNILLFLASLPSLVPDTSSVLHHIAMVQNWHMKHHIFPALAQYRE